MSEKLYNATANLTQSIGKAEDFDQEKGHEAHSEERGESHVVFQEFGALEVEKHHK